VSEPADDRELAVQQRLHEAIEGALAQWATAPC
jgi:hypothetical protein